MGACHTVYVHMLGGFSLSCAGVRLEGKGGHARRWVSMLAFLLMNRARPVLTQELAQAVGIGREEGDVSSALRTAVYRLRREIRPVEAAAGKPLILARRGAYLWNPDLPTEVDIERFEALYNEEETPARDLELLGLYRGDFLASVPTEIWADALADRYRILYVAAVEQALPVLADGGRLKEAMEHCEAAIRCDPYRESLYRWLMEQRAACGDSAGATAAYEELRTLLDRDLDVCPEENTRQTYQSLLSRMEYAPLEADRIREQLQEPNPAPGPMLCEFSAFRAFYRAEARAAVRKGNAVHIAVLTVSAQKGRSITKRGVESAMRELEEQIVCSLRTGDIAARCSPTQYAVMLIQSNLENSRKVCDRLIRSCRGISARITAEIFPVEPVVKSAAPSLQWV